VDISLPNGNDSGNELKKNKAIILGAIKNNPHITLDELVIVTGKSKCTISHETKEMQLAGNLRRTGSARTGSWEVLNLEPMCKLFYCTLTKKHKKS